MDNLDVDRAAAWLVKAGLAGMSEADLMHGFCEKCRSIGMDLSTAVTLIDTLHPVYEGRAFLWRGDVLKLMGDGVLAVFNAAHPAESCRCARRAEAELRFKIEELNANRSRNGRPISTVYLGLHIGDVFFGKIGSEERLDFTVVGPAVNEVSRIASMCRSVDRATVVSSEFAAATPEPERVNLASVGRYALRGVARAQELFTLCPPVIAP